MDALTLRLVAVAGELPACIARLFRFGAEGELRASIEAAVTALAGNIVAGTTTTSPACAPGWEGGQPPHE